VTNASADTKPDPRLDPALARFKAAVIGNGLTEAHFLPPVSADRVQAVFAELDLPLHPDIATLYAWSEGYSRKLGHPDSFFPMWFMTKLDQSTESREGMSHVFDLNPTDADLWPLFSIDHAELCVHTGDGTLWEIPAAEAGQQVKPPAYLADLFNFWAHLHEAGFYELIDGGWHDEYDRGLRDFGTNWHPLQEYA